MQGLVLFVFFQKYAFFARVQFYFVFQKKASSCKEQIKGLSSTHQATMMDFFGKIALSF